MSLVIENLVSGYIKEVDVLKGISFQLDGTKITTMIGPNGAGKSTVLKSIFGLITIKSGKINFKGEDITNYEPGEILHTGISYVPQGRCNFPKMTVKENLEMGAFTITKKEKINNRIKKLEDIFPLLNEKKHTLAGNLSGGQQQVLEMGMALMLDPEMLMIDEPTLGLAPTMASTVLEEIRKINEFGCSVLMVEQNAKQALSMSDYGIVLELGQKRYGDVAEELLKNPEVKKLYLGG